MSCGARSMPGPGKRSGTRRRTRSDGLLRVGILLPRPAGRSRQCGPRLRHARSDAGGFGSVYERQSRTARSVVQVRFASRPRTFFSGRRSSTSGRSYDVNHEALIRGWKTYANWLKDARRRVDRLVTVDHIIGDSGAPEQIGGLARMWTKLTPLSSDVERCARASQIAGAETSADLQDVLGPDGAFSDQWARQTLERSDAASPNLTPIRDPSRIGSARSGRRCGMLSGIPRSRPGSSPDEVSMRYWEFF